MRSSQKTEIWVTTYPKLTLIHKPCNASHFNSFVVTWYQFVPFHVVINRSRVLVSTLSTCPTYDFELQHCRIMKTTFFVDEKSLPLRILLLLSYLLSLTDSAKFNLKALMFQKKRNSLRNYGSLINCDTDFFLKIPKIYI